MPPDHAPDREQLWRKWLDSLLIELSNHDVDERRMAWELAIDVDSLVGPVVRLIGGPLDGLRVSVHPLAPAVEVPVVKKSPGGQATGIVLVYRRDADTAHYVYATLRPWP